MYGQMGSETKCKPSKIKEPSDSICVQTSVRKDSGPTDVAGGSSFFMKWFKHESTACKDEVIRSLIDSNGIESYGIFMILLELCAEKIDKDLNTKVVCGWPFIEYLTRSRRSTVRRVIATCASLGLLVDESSDLQMVCSIPNLLKRLDNWTQDFQASSKKVSLEEEVEEEQEVKNKKEKPRRFSPPTTYEETEAYFLELGHSSEAGKFLDFYASKGWMVGKNKMKDWRAAARNWMRRKNENTHEPPRLPEKLSVKTETPDRTTQPRWDYPPEVQRLVKDAMPKVSR